jgi:peptidoglycan/xylan/chitin deacetylase (PgdA/CDA1 family)
MVDVKRTIIRTIFGALRWSGAAAMAQPFLGGCGSILMLHHVSNANWSPLGLHSGLTITPEFLDRLLADIRRRGLAIVPMDEIPEILRAGRARQVVAITADDAYLDNLTEALPVFEAHDAPFTIYVAPGLISGETVAWWEVIEKLPLDREELRVVLDGEETVLPCRTMAEKRAAAARLMAHQTTRVPEEEQQAFLATLGGEMVSPVRSFMNWDELRGIAAHPLVTLGAHTVHHAAVKRLDAERALWEMEESAAILARETGLEPRHFAFPYGHRAAAGERDFELVRRAGFATAVTTRHGVLVPGHSAHLHALPRVSVNGNFQSVGDVRTMMSGLTALIANRGRRLVTA